MEERTHYLRSLRVLWGTAALTVAAAVAAVLTVREVAVRMLHPNPAFTPLDLGSPVVATIICTMMAIYVFVGMASYPNAVPHMASNFSHGLDPVVCAVPAHGDFTLYRRRLARGFRPHDDARGSVGDLRNALTLARDHEAPSQSPGL